LETEPEVKPEPAVKSEPEVEPEPLVKTAAMANAPGSTDEVREHSPVQKADRDWAPEAPVQLSPGPEPVLDGSQIVRNEGVSRLTKSDD
jgi:hypothetical protein